VDLLPVKTPRRECFVDVTAAVARCVQGSGIVDGLCHVFVTHTTAGVTINENADPAVTEDILAFLADAVPRGRPYRHAEGNSDAHIKASLLGSSVFVPVSQGRLALGTWQGIYFAEFDGPRARELRVTLLAER
jgi:secondary thiamine-phosphate synthase enzyme